MAPLSGIGGQFLRVPLQLGHILERVHASQLTGMDQTHEEVARFGAVQGLVEQRIFAMEHGALQRLFADVVVERRASLAQKHRQSLPVPEQICDGFAQPRVQLGLLFVDLRFQPRVQLLHHRSAVLLMEAQSLSRRQLSFTCLRIVVIYPPPRLPAHAGMHQESSARSRRTAFVHAPGSWPVGSPRHWSA